MTRLIAPAVLFAAMIGGLLWIAAGALAAASERAVLYRTLAEALTPVATPTRSVTWEAPDRVDPMRLAEIDALWLAAFPDQAAIAAT